MFFNKASTLSDQKKTTEGDRTHKENACVCVFVCIANLICLAVLGEAAQKLPMLT